MKEQWNESTATAKGLYDPSFEHDNCGIGAVVNIKGIKTHQTVENALKIVENLKHRAGKDADGKTGDGVGILLQISHKFFKKATEPLGIKLGEERDYGVGMFFFPQDELKTNQAKKMFEVIVEKEGMEFLGWRQVPIHPDKLSDKARGCMPCIMQCFVKRPKNVEKGLDFVSKSDKLLTLGIKPNRPETGYGYIQIAEQEGDNFYKVKTFTEKPELELAKVFVESGEFYWNSGLFMWNVNTIIKAGETLLPELASKLAPGREIYGTPEEKDFIEENFPACPNVSIDFGIMEKADNVYVSLGDFGWSDLGTWGSLYDLSPKDEQRNVTLKCDSLIYNSNDNIVVLPKGKLAVIEGLEGFLVAESDNVLLICKKDEEHAIRKYVNDAQMKLGEDYI